MSSHPEKEGIGTALHAIAHGLVQTWKKGLREKQLVSSEITDIQLEFNLIFAALWIASVAYEMTTEDKATFERNAKAMYDEFLKALRQAESEQMGRSGPSTFPSLGDVLQNEEEISRICKEIQADVERGTGNRKSIDQTLQTGFSTILEYLFPIRGPRYQKAWKDGAAKLYGPTFDVSLELYRDLTGNDPKTVEALPAVLGLNIMLAASFPAIQKTLAEFGYHP